MSGRAVYEAFLLDFYGTLVEEDTAVISRIGWRRAGRRHLKTASGLAIRLP